MAPSFSFSSEVRSLMESAGWYEGRNASGTFDIPSDVQYPQKIQLILNEFGGLFVHSSGRGIILSKLSIEFDPSWAEKESSEGGILRDYSTRTGLILYPLGHVPDESLTLCIDIQGNVYMAGDYLYLVGKSFEEGVSHILLGIEGKQLNEQTLLWE